MSTFRTEINLDSSSYPDIQVNSRIFLIGSCFSDNIGDKFELSGFRTLSNPLGIAYNPYSIADQIDRMVNETSFTENDLFQKGEFFNSYDLHGSFDRTSKDQLLTEANRALQESFSFLQKASHAFITLGTAWVYRLKEQNKIVNNCHRQVSALFSKELLNTEACNELCKKMTNSLHQLNPELEIIFTLSPVRHLKDGFRENSHSKSILRLSIEHSLKKKVTYFPSYEIVQDDLRDYRFYKSDLLHPNEMAIDYLWEKLKGAMFSSETTEYCVRAEKIRRALDHRSLNPGSKSERDFLKNLEKQIRELIAEFPDANFSTDLKQVGDRLTE